jgi:MinD-like ATPase involved in chromosome partitioning or flagellar assembly
MPEEHVLPLAAAACAGRTRPQLIAFLAGAGGVGTTTATAGVAIALAAVRSDRVAAVSARPYVGSLGLRVFGPRPPRVVRAGPAGGRLTVLDTARWPGASGPANLVPLLDRLSDDHPLTLVDVGNAQGDHAHRALGRADLVVLVTAAGPDAVAAVGSALDRVRQVDPGRLPGIVVVLTCLTARQHRWAGRRLRQVLDQDAGRIVLVPFDAGLARHGWVNPDWIGFATSMAFVRIAALVAAPAPPTVPIGPRGVS